MLRRLAALAAAFALSLVATHASAYCRSSTGCDPSGKHEGKICDPMEPGDCGQPLVWKQPCIGFNIQQDGSPLRGIDYATADQAMQAAFNAWLNSACDGGGPSLGMEDLGPVQCGRNEYNEHGGNANALIFQDQAWPHQGVLDGNQDIALTTVTYDTNTGEIFDADIEVNSKGYKLTTDDKNVDTDLVSVLTHEAGHFLGLGHSDPGNVMQPTYTMGSVRRDPTTDDQNGMCAIYPPGRPTQGACTYLPRHGFSPRCSADQTELKCSIDVPGAPASPSPLVALALVGGALAAVRARSGSRRRSRTLSR